MKIPILTSSVALVCIVSFIFPRIASILIYDREGILGGEVWRLFSCHWVHFNGWHLLYNLVVFVTVGFILEKNNYYQLLFIYVFSALIISVTLLVLKPDMIFYGGLSGIAICIVYYCALIKMNERHWRWICKGVIICLPIKITIELCSQASMLPYWGTRSFVMMPISHVMGLIVGFSYYLLTIIHDRRRWLRITNKCPIRFMKSGSF